MAQRPPDLDATGQPAGGAGRPPDLDHEGKAVTATPSTPVSDKEPGDWWGGWRKSLIDQATHATTGSVDANGLPSVHAASPDVEKFATTPLARPTGNDTVDSFLSPASLALMAAGGVVGGAGALKRGAVATAKNLPISGTLRMGANIVEASPAVQKWIPFADKGAELVRNLAQATKDQQMGVARGAAQYEMGPSERIVDRAPRAAQVIGDASAGPFVTPPDLTRPVQAGSLSPAEMRARFDAVKAAGGLPPQQAVPPSTQPSVGQLRMASGQGGPSGVGAMQPEPTAIPNPLPAQPAAPPMRVDPASLPADWKTSVPDKVGSALDPARVDIGAEQAGRATGMTKQQVRDVATPILDAAPGAASPILPEAALKRMIDTLKALPKGGPEREAYVAKATSGKTQWQVENIRRTLEHLGLVVPAVASGAEMVRQTILNRLNGSEQPGQEFQ